MLKQARGVAMGQFLEALDLVEQLEQADDEALLRNVLRRKIGHARERDQIGLAKAGADPGDGPGAFEQGELDCGGASLELLADLSAQVGGQRNGAAGAAPLSAKQRGRDHPEIDLGGGQQPGFRREAEEPAQEGVEEEHPVIRIA